jgi:hypothetical protein
MLPTDAFCRTLETPEHIVTCQERRDLLLLYAADALDAGETAEMRQHLQTGCPQCAGYLAEATAVLNALPLDLDPVAPSPKLKQKLMQRIDSSPAWLLQQPPLTAQTPAPTPTPAPRAPAPSSFRLSRYLIPTAIAAGLAIILTRSVMMQHIDDLQHQVNTWQQRSADASAQVQQLQQLRGQFQSQSQVVEMLQSPGLKLIPLKPTDLQPHAVANLLWDQKKHQWAILTTGMTPAAPGQTYELWFVTATGATAAGTFDVDAKGAGSLLVDIPPNLGDLKVAAVTNEKAGGVPQPQGNFQVKGTVD